MCKSFTPGGFPALPKQYRNHGTHFA